MEKDDLTSKQLGLDGKSQYAVFLPALSSFYSRDVGKQRDDPSYIDPARVPADFEHGVEGLNWLNADEAYFPYKWSLYSAGHAELDITKNNPRDWMISKRDRNNTFVLGDSGGFQIGKGVWEGDWKDPSCPKAQKKREQVLAWLDAYMDYGMVLDIPAWVVRSPPGRIATGINTYDEAVKATEINNDYFMNNRSGQCKFLNVLQGENHTQADDWYAKMKHYCDPKKHERPFNGWSMGGQNMCDISLILRRLVEMRHDGLLEKGYHDWMHFLGTSKLEWACILTDIQRAVRKYHNDQFTVSFDCASPFLASANGQLYITTELDPGKKWSYRMTASVDDKKYATDSRRFSDAVLTDGIFSAFEDSPITSRCKVSDICIYKPGDLNKIGREGRTSWDSFSYTIQMGHNVHRHIYAVQEANRRYDLGQQPGMLRRISSGELETTRQLIDEIFATSDKGKALDLIKQHSRFWDSVIGSRGNVGKKITNAISTAINLYGDDIVPNKAAKPLKAKAKPVIVGHNLFEGMEDDEAPKHHIDDSGLDESSLNNLEDNV